MSKLKNYVSANLPDLSPSQAAIIIATLEAVTNALWANYGEKIENSPYIPKPPPQTTLNSNSKDDFEPFF